MVQSDKNGYVIGASPEAEEPPTPKLSTFSLAKYFDQKLRPLCWGSADVTNRQALTQQLNNLRNNGVAPETMKLMIDIFASQVRRSPEMARGKSVWKVFLARRVALLEQAKNDSRSQNYTYTPEDEMVTMADLMKEE